MLLAICLLKDILGLVGSVLIALPFFSQDGVKRLVRRLQAVSTDDPAIKHIYQTAATRQRDLMENPNDQDLRNTKVGLALSIVSFALSIALTFAQATTHKGT